mmetsp:Transcript_7550/g.4050  ORF Transcript_7550/g.4050 Transcript_7550/m.4050 type:complete len:87 (+) Transcript_7550:279-539(+)
MLIRNYKVVVEPAANIVGFHSGFTQFSLYSDIQEIFAKPNMLLVKSLCSNLPSEQIEIGKDKLGNSLSKLLKQGVKYIGHRQGKLC